VTDFLLIGLGAALGANARYWVALWAAGRWGATFPYGTLIVNVSGSMLLGAILALSAERFHMSAHGRALLIVGFLGAYTTFSTYAVESVLLLQGRALWSGVLNILGNNLLSLLAALAGLALVRLWR
jgi:CrcB protein